MRVRLQCATAGTYTGTVTISSNDPDENPYRFYVTGTVTNPGSPEISVTRAWDNVAVASGGSFAFPDPLRTGQTDSRLFRIANTGNATLTIANPTTLVSGTCFSLIEQPTATVAAGGTTQFRVRLQCGAPGTYTGAVSIQNNDADENPYTIYLSGTVVANGATFVSQVFPPAMSANQFYDVSVTMKNSGTTTWTNAKNYRLGIRPDTAGAQWRFDGRSYLSATDSIAPGASKTFTLRLQAPSTAGTYTLQWQMVEEMVEWFGAVSPLITVTVGAPRNDAVFVSQSVPSTMVAGQKYNVSVTMKNTGGTTWSETTHHRLGNQIAGDPFTHRRLLPSGVTVAPGAQYTFAWQVTAPATAGTYTFQWRMVEEMVEWFGPFTPSTPVTVRIAMPPIVDAITPDTIPGGTVATVTVAGHRLGGTTVKFGQLDASTVSPAATLLSVSPDGTQMTVRVDATNSAVTGFHPLVVSNADGKGAGEVRIVPSRPVVDVYTPSQASWGDLYFFTVAGVNLSGVQVVPMSSAVQFVGIEGDDGMLSGILEVDPGTGSVDTTVELRGSGGVTSVPLQLRDRTAITQKSSLAGKSAATGSEGVWIQDPVSLLSAAAPKFLDWEITCRYRRERTRGHGGVLLGLKEIGKRLNPHVLENFARGETRLIQTLITIYSFSFTLSIDIFCRIDSEGNEDFDIFFCIAVESYIETIGLGGQRISIEACTGTNDHVEITGSGFWNFHYRWGDNGTSPTSPCVSAVDRSPNPFDGPRLTDVTMNNCCEEELTIDMEYKLGEDAADTVRPGRIPAGNVTPSPNSCPVHTVTITKPPDDPSPPDLGNNFSFLAQRDFAQTANGDTIEAEATVAGGGNAADLMWTITPTIGAVRQVMPTTRKGPTLSFIPDPPDHPQYLRGTGCSSPGNGSCDASDPLKYAIKAQYDCGTAGCAPDVDENTIVQDQTDIIRQEYRNHGLSVPERSEFNSVIGTANFTAAEINNTAYTIVRGTPGTVAQTVRDVFNTKIHDDIQLRPFGSTGNPPSTPIVGPGANVQIIGAILTTPPCYQGPPGCDDVRFGDLILAGPNGIAETRARFQVTSVPIRINSGWRNPERNEAVNGVLNSNHQMGNAVDLDILSSAEGLTVSQLFCVLQTAADDAGYNGFAENFSTQVSCDATVTHVHVQPN